MIVVLSHIVQTVEELRWQPQLTIAQSGKERGNLYIHRTLIMGVLIFWDKLGQPPHWALAVYVLAVSGLFTWSQLYPRRYLQLIGSTGKSDRR